MILSCLNVCKSFGDEEILKDVTFNIEEGDKAAIVGVNGAGKTTLFKILSRRLERDSGEVSFSNKIRSVGYLAQTGDLTDDLTVYETFIEVFRPLLNLEDKMRELEIEMAADNRKEILDKYDKLRFEFESANGYEYKSRVKGVIKGLGFTEEEAARKTGVLSGGEKTRVSLGKLLLAAPDLLLLDEPTNHLDIESVEWLEVFLKEYKKTILIISHDRYFLDKISNKVIEIENKKAKLYLGNYTDFARKKETERNIELKHYFEQQKEIKRQEEIIKRFKMYNTEASVKKAESREKFLERMEKVEKPESEPSKIRFAITPKIQSGEEVLRMEGVAKSFGETELFRNVSFVIRKKEKAALIGPNGIGKTTLIKIISEGGEGSGRVEKGVNVITGYYDQSLKFSDEEKTVLEDVISEARKLGVSEIRNALAAFVFTGDDVFKKISALSGGEKGRLFLCKIMLSRANFLILDEPTNHLDIYSKQILEEALRNYEGTVLFVSHDRYFINNAATKIFELSDSGIETFFGNYDYYLEKKAEKAEDPKPQAPKERKIIPDRNENRKIRAKIRKLESELQTAETQIEQINEDIQVHSANHELLTKLLNEKEFLENKALELMSELENFAEP